MGFGFNNFDSDSRGTLYAGQIRRGSQSMSTAWAEENLTDTDLVCGTFVAFNKDGGVKPLSADDDVIHGLVLSDVYGDKVPNDKIANIAHCSEGDEFVVIAKEGEGFERGDALTILMTGADAGKVAKTGGTATNFVASYVSGDLVAFTRREVSAVTP